MRMLSVKNVRSLPICKKVQQKLDRYQPDKREPPLIMKSNGSQRSMVEVSNAMATEAHRSIAGSRFCRSSRETYGGLDGATVSDRQHRHGMDKEQYQQRASLHRKPHQRHLLGGHRHPEQQPEQLHVVAKPKLIPRFTRFQVLRIIKLATMDKLRESDASGADDPTRQRLATEGTAPGGVGTGGNGCGERGTGSGEGGSDEYHHQFYNTGRIGRRNALPDILGTHCTTTTADLSSQLGALSTSECAGKPSDGSGAISSSIAPPGSGQTPTTTGGT